MKDLKKTSWYGFIYPRRVGALVARSGHIEKDEFCRLGWYFVAAFQIQDDILNLTADSRKYGKEIAGDLWEGKRTLILIHALKNCSARDRARLRQFLAQPRQSHASPTLSGFMICSCVTRASTMLAAGPPIGGGGTVRGIRSVSRNTRLRGKALHPGDDPVRRQPRPLSDLRLLPTRQVILSAWKNMVLQRAADRNISTSL